MELLTRKKKASEAARRWKSNYFRDGQWMTTAYGCSGEVHKNLLSLGDHPEHCKVDTAIGNDSWTALECGECNSDVDQLVQLGDEPDYESSTAWVCFPCLAKALELKTEAI